MKSVISAMILFIAISTMHSYVENASERVIAMNQAAAKGEVLLAAR